MTKQKVNRATAWDRTLYDAIMKAAKATGLTWIAYVRSAVVERLKREGAL